MKRLFDSKKCIPVIDPVRFGMTGFYDRNAQISCDICATVPLYCFYKQTGADSFDICENCFNQKE